MAASLLEFARRKSPNPNANVVFAHEPVPPEVMADRDRRLSAPQTITARVFGDPPPGQSALDRMAMDANQPMSFLTVRRVRAFNANFGPDGALLDRLRRR